MQDFLECKDPVMQAGQSIKKVRSRWPATIAVAVVATLVGLVVLTATNRTTDSDPMGSLLATESLVQGNGMALDHYPDLVKSVLGDRVEVVNNRTFYYFPIGTSLLVAPVIALTSAFGVDVVMNDHKIQISLAAASAILTFLLLYIMARRFIGRWMSLLLATSFWFGTSFASSGATALWSHNFGSAMTLAALICLVTALQRQQTSWLVGSAALTGAAFIIRPQAALLAVGVLVLLALRWRRGLPWFLAPFAAVISAFVIFSHTVLDMWLPSYYLPQRLDGGEFWLALAGVMISPGRGLVVFTPLLLILALTLSSWRRISANERALVLLGVGWLIAHWLAIARFPHWWGGWSFGPRLMIDVLPGIFLAVVVLWPRSLTAIRAKAIVGVFVLLAVWSAWINTAVGLYNPYSRFWYIDPSVDVAPEMIWDLRYPQFMASESGHEDRATRRLENLPALRPGVKYSPESPELGFVGWSTGFWSPGYSLESFWLGTPAWWSEGERRWSEGESARLLFNLQDQDVNELQGRIEIPLDTFGVQRIDVSLNGTPVHITVVAGAPDQASPAQMGFAFDSSLLRSGVNQLVFNFPDHKQVGSASSFREIAVALKGFLLL